VKVRLTFAMVVGTATLILGATPQATLETPRIPEAGPIARPRSAPVRTLARTMDALVGWRPNANG